MNAHDHGSTLVPLNDLSRALQGQREDLLGAVARVIDSGWLVHGPEHAAFEQELAAFVGATHALGVASGTDALELAMRALAAPGRTTVVVAANCGGYSATAARRAGLTPRYVEVDPTTHLVTPETLAPALDDSVAVVVVTHLYGRAADVAPIRELVARHGARVLEDCAQALGALTSEGRVGSLGDAAAFSFYPTKNLGALGDGGAITTDDAGTAARVRELRQYGWEGKYTISTDGGRNSRLDEIQAAVLRTRLPLLDEDNARRRAIISAYAAAATGRVTVLPAPDASHTGHLAVAVTDERDALVAHLAAHGIRTDVHYPVPDHLQPAFAAEYAATSLPVTEGLASRIVSLPVFPELTAHEVDRVCSALRSF
ncbi:DegT/DnrJ/EryC1/StrS family aminotransferase [Sanguibacter massiliensis]|uniref:DegT/DnrJ/EryC1/StrS family aminotransferase n=1 Tax=Sanguibacter massiliensis TaxID=1973217 RepID=UPI000C8443E7|nr:DegT/DnrJ/EryC1/StrS family aminotransferase [Sanguibacter massiliensis]